MQTIKDKKIVNLNSNNANFYSNGSFLSDMVFTFSTIVSKNDNISILEGGIQSAQFAVSFYIINYSNNILSYSIQNGATVTTYSISLNVGNYDYKTLFSEMKTKFLANGHNFNMSINSIDGIITFTYIPVSSEYFLRINSVSTCYKIIGLVLGVNYNANSNVLTCVYPLNLLGIKKLKIYVNELSSSNLDSSNFSNTNLTQTISNSASPWGMIDYTNIDTQYPLILNHDINQLTVQIKDEFDNFINFNGIDWTMTIVFYIYKNLEVTKKISISEYLRNGNSIENDFVENDFVENDSNNEETIVEEQQNNFSVPISDEYEATYDNDVDVTIPIDPDLEELNFLAT